MDETTDESAFADWSMETTRRLSRTILRCGPGTSVIDLVRTFNPGHEPTYDPEYETDIHEDMLSVVLAHAFYQTLLSEAPELATQLADLSYAEALHVVYHQRDT